MHTILSLLCSLAGLGTLIFGIMIWMKLYPKEGVPKLILAIICFIYTLIWGWQHKDSENIDMPVKGYTACVGLLIIFDIAMMVVH